MYTELQSDKVRLDLGLEKPIRILHLTDVHLSLADDTDGDAMKQHAANRRHTFQNEAGYPARDPVGYLEDAMEYAKEFDATVITGDVVDFTSHANLEVAKKILAGHDYLFAAGNHEFCPMVGTPDSFETRDRMWDTVQASFRGDMGFESRLVGGVNLIAIDNSYFIWTKEQFERLQAECSRGVPCLVFCHTPLSDNHLNHTPHHKDLPVDDETVEFTRKVTQYIIDSPAVKAVFAGHYHSAMTQDLGNGKSCYVCAGLFKGKVGEIEIV